MIKINAIVLYAACVSGSLAMGQENPIRFTQEQRINREPFNTYSSRRLAEFCRVAAINESEYWQGRNTLTRSGKPHAQLKVAYHKHRCKCTLEKNEDDQDFVSAMDQIDWRCRLAFQEL